MKDIFKKLMVLLVIVEPLVLAPSAMAKSTKYTVLKVSKLNTASRTVTGTATKSAKITVKHGLDLGQESGHILCII